MEDTTDADYKYVRRALEDFGIKNLCKYMNCLCRAIPYNQWIHSKTHAASKRRYADPNHFLATPVLAWQVYLKEAEVELELLKDIDMLLNVQNDIRGRICHATDQHSKGSNRYMKESNPNK